MTTFKAGETYQTREGHEAHILRRVGQYLIGYIWLEECPLPYRWDSNGLGMGRHTPHDLAPPKRQVWVAVWLAPGDESPQTHACFSESAAEDCIIGNKWEKCRRIAVAGPFDVDAAS